MAKSTNPERIREVYDRAAAGYDGPATEGMARRARARIGRMAEGRVLEIGIGTGLNLAHYSPAVELTGIDLSPRMLDRARGRAAELGRTADLRVMDAERLEFADHSFDTVVFSLCLCTIPKPERAIQEALRVARPGARIILFEHVRSHLMAVALLQDLITPLTVLCQADHWNRRTLDAVRAAGIELESVRRAWLGVFVFAAGRAPAATAVAPSH